MSNFRKLTRPESYMEGFHYWQYILGKNNELRNKIASSNLSDEEKEVLIYALFKCYCYITLVDMELLYINDSFIDGLIISKLGEINELKN